MTNFTKTVVDTKIKRVFKTTASVLLVILMTLAMVLTTNQEIFAAGTNNETWAITIGDEEILYVDSEESGQEVIEGLKEYYLTEGSTLVDVQFDPEIAVKKVNITNDTSDSYFASSIATKDVETAVKEIGDGEIRYSTYLIEEGDTLESIAEARGISAEVLVALNYDLYDSDETIKEGTYILIYSEVPYVNVTTIESVTSTKSIDYKTVYKTTSSLQKGQTKVSVKGVKGSKQLVKQVTKVNGETTDSELISSEVTEDPTTKVVLKGTATVTARRGVTYDSFEGSDVVDYAKKFVGNPYRYGGTSLTNGADCSGFVYSVYKHFGVNLPRVGQSSVGKTVSYSNVKKGDILFYPGHVAIYAGNGKAIHAVNERLGIRVTGAFYTGSVIAVRRIFE